MRFEQGKVVGGFSQSMARRHHRFKKAKNSTDAEWIAPPEADSNPGLSIALTLALLINALLVKMF